MLAPSFLGALYVVHSSDLLFTEPGTGLESAARALGLVAVDTPLSLLPLEVVMAWPRRLHGDTPSRWFRRQVIGVLGGPEGPDALARTSSDFLQLERLSLRWGRGFWRCLCPCSAGPRDSW